MLLRDSDADTYVAIFETFIEICLQSDPSHADSSFHCPLCLLTKRAILPLHFLIYVSSSLLITSLDTLKFTALLELLVCALKEATSVSHHSLALIPVSGSIHVHT